MSIFGRGKLEPAVALAATVFGIALTTCGVFGHLAQLVAPGATLVFVAAAWSGIALARRDVRLFPFQAALDPSDHEDH